MKSFLLDIHRRKIAFIIFTIVWSMIVLVLFTRGVETVNTQIYNLALQSGRNNFDKDVVYRDWVAKVGGVYVPVTENTPPNPYLDVPNRDVETTGGVKLTLINPAYMTRLVHNLQTGENSISGHITSLNPIAPYNSADEWEVRALNLFKGGLKEYHSIETVEGRKVLRYMAPFVTTEPCLKCHAHQGYEVGDIRGGISVNVPYDKYSTMSNLHWEGEIIFHGAIWLVGFAFMLLYYKVSSMAKKEVDKKEVELIKKNEELEDQARLLSENEASLKESQKIAHVGHWTLDPDINESYWSDELRRITGINPEEYNWDLEKIVKQVVHPEEMEKAINSFNLVRMNEARQPVELRIIREDKSIRTLIMYPAATKYDSEKNKTVLSGVVQDITERKKAEEILIEKERLSVIGETTSAVAHDFNNALQAIISNLELTLISNELSESNKSKIEQALDISMDTSERIKVLQKFGSKSPHQTVYRNIEITSVIDASVIQSRAFWKDTAEKEGKDIFVETRYHGKAYIEANDAELKSVFSNLIKNSCEAIERSGKITIETATDKDSLIIMVKDNGAGMDEEVKKRMFQPFFTTKGFEAGRGIGLSGVYRILQEHNAKISLLESSPGEGTTIKIEFPLAEKDIAKDESESPGTTDRVLKVLWVDDDDAIREIAAEMFNSLGHQGRVVSNGSEALKILENESFDLIFTDLGMPGMNGWEFAGIVNEKYDNKYKIAVLSGWGNQIEPDKLEQLNIAGVLTKPFKLNDLKKLIMELI